MFHRWWNLLWAGLLKDSCRFCRDLQLHWCHYWCVRGCRVVLVRVDKYCSFRVGAIWDSYDGHVVPFRLCVVVSYVASSGFPNGFVALVAWLRCLVYASGRFSFMFLSCSATFGLFDGCVFSSFVPFIFWTIKSIDFLRGPGSAMKSLGELEVTIVIGPCCGESEMRLITSTVSELLQESRSVCTRDAFLRGCCCRRLACSNLDCASAACFDFVSNCVAFWLFVFVIGLPFLLGLFVFDFFCFLLCFVYE